MVDNNRNTATKMEVVKVTWSDCLASNKKDIGFIESQCQAWSKVDDHEDDKNFKAYFKQFDKLKLKRQEVDAAQKAAELKEQLEVIADPRPGDEGYVGPQWVHIRETKYGWKPISHADNTRALLNQRGITVAYDEMAKEPFIDIPQTNIHEDTGFTTRCVMIEDIAREEDYPTTAIMDHLVVIANQNYFHPVKDWIESKQWDGVDRFEDLIDTITADDKPLLRMLMKMWLMNAIAAVFQFEGFASQGVLTLVGKQGLGKSRWMLSLVPEKCWLAEGVTLDMRDKDSVLRVIKHWIVELGEIDSTFRKSDIAALKAFITTQKDILRVPYGRKAESFKRRTVLSGTVNDMNFLQDTENRRFWCIGVDALNHEHTIDIQQLWAQMLHEWRSDPERRFWLTPDQQRWLAESNKKYMSYSAVIQKFEAKYCHPDSDCEKIDEPARMTVTEICVELEERTDKQTLNALAAYLDQQGYKRWKNDGRFVVSVREIGSQFRDDEVVNPLLEFDDDDEIAKERNKWIV